MKTLLSRFGQSVSSLPSRLRHLSRRQLMWALAAMPVLLLLYVLVLIPFTPSIADLRKAKTAKPSVVLSADGVELAVFKRANREWVKLADISPHVRQALIATEDHRFYQHRGMDLKRTVSAFFHTLTGDLQGGSTITQQLARNLFPEDIGRAASLPRKIKEAITAFKIESVYTKDEILESYLNTVPFLYNAYGIEIAARTYFDKSADELDLLESATLVGMLKGTSYYNPVINPERSMQRRNIVLAQMAKHDKLPQARLASLQKMPLRIDFERQTETLGPAPHFAQQLKRWLIEWADRNDYDIHADGLVVRTTLDSRLQDMANKAVAAQADRLQLLADAQWGPRAGWKTKKNMVLLLIRSTPEFKAALTTGLNEDQVLQKLQSDETFMRKLRDDKTRLQAGFLALDPRNGQVRAWVGSRDFAGDQFDHVQQAHRQPGSTFKPFVYGAAFEDGAKPTDTFVDRAVEIPLGNGAFWRPTDGGGPSGATMTLRQGLMYSKNTITAQVMHKVGPAHVATLARSMGVRQSKLQEVPSLALGTSPVTLKEMVASYSTIANDGQYIEPVLLTQVENREGAVLEAFQPAAPETAMDVSVAHGLLDAMRGVIDRGTGTGIRNRFGIRADVAGKTGTTQDNTDGWFILMHPHLVAGAWVGFNDNRVTMGDRWGQGAQSALPMVGAFFQQAFNARMVDAQTRFSAPPSYAGNSGASSSPAGPDPMLGLENEAALNGETFFGTDQQQADNRARETPGMAPPEGASGQPAPVIRYITIPAPTPDGELPEQEMRAIPRPFELLPPEGRRSRRIELPRHIPEE
ncbi:MAG: glycosyl transferase, family 51 [Polaromonas sp.]|nr:glycosyl transferase, family 51 [Polaromonas sp.]